MTRDGAKDYGSATIYSTHNNRADHTIQHMTECAADRVASDLPVYLEVLDGMMATDPTVRLTAKQALGLLASFRS